MREPFTGANPGMASRSQTTRSLWIAFFSTTTSAAPSNAVADAEVPNPTRVVPMWVPGSCGATSWSPADDQCACDDQGSFKLAPPDLASWDTAAKACQWRCQFCARCRWISVSLQWADCSWYAGCDAPSTEVAGFYSGEVNTARPLPPPPAACGLKCGWHRDCPQRYTAAEVEASAASWAPHDRSLRAALAAREQEAEEACVQRGEATSYRNQNGLTPRQRNGTAGAGGWCLGSEQQQLVDAGRQRYRLPPAHVPADEGLVSALSQLVLRTSPHRLNSLNDFGAGVGQYGHSLLMREPSLRYRGYDGAGDVRRYTDGFVRFVDLSMPLSLPRTDYVLSLEVGEHIPREHEFMYVRNLHAHNCRGIVLSWANIEQMGVAHVNTHSRKYLRTLFASLGYVHSANVSRALRRAARVNWLKNNLLVFDRISPICRHSEVGPRAAGTMAPRGT